MRFSGDNQPTQPMRSHDASTQPLNAAFRVELDRTSLDVYPASSAAVEIRIRNTSAATLRFCIQVDGLPESWTRLRNSAPQIESGETGVVRLSVAPERSPDLPPADYPCVITVSADEHPPLTLPLLVRLRGFSGIALGLAPAALNDGDRFTLWLRNLGSIDLSLRIADQVDNSNLEIQMDRRSLLLPFGKKEGIAGTVRARKRPIAGRPRTVPFSLIIKPEASSAWQVALPASVSLTPRLSRRLFASLILLLLVLTSLAFFLLPQKQPPKISAFTLSSTHVTQGEPAQLNWKAQFAERIVIEVDRAAVAELPGAAESFTLTTTAYDGEVTIALIALSGEDRAIARRELFFAPPLEVIHFSADPTALRRHVRAELRLTWEVAGASDVAVAHPPEFEKMDEIAQESSGGEIVLVGAPASDIELRLIAEDESGAKSERQLIVRVLDAECTPLREAPIHAGPDSRFQQGASAISQVPLLVQGINAARDWLQVELASGETGWARLSDFACAEFDPERLRLIQELPLPPPLTNTPAPAPFETEESPTVEASQ